MKVSLSLLALCCTATLTAQVGVNNADPQQALDVGGKVKIADDGETPTAGTLRYNAADGQFEGHDGRGWSNLSASATGPLPTGPIPVAGIGFASSSNAKDNARLYYPDSRLSFTQVPAGKFLVVTALNIAPNALTVSSANKYFVTVGASDTPTGLLYTSTGLKLTGDLGATRLLQSGLAPLLVIRGGQYLTVVQDDLQNNTERGIDIEFRGFLVDDLTY